jgi:signal transduction histidine kinase
MLRRALITFETKIDIKNLMVEVEFENEREYALADKSQIMQVIQNIMDNAIKFADYGGRLRISVTNDKDSVIISINNSGDPIPRSDIPYLFDRFYKGDVSHTRVREGTGIGLSIVKKILEEHRQKIWVESDRMGGTTFTFTLSRAGLDKPVQKAEKV